MYKFLLIILLSYSTRTVEYYYYIMLLIYNAAAQIIIVPPPSICPSTNDTKEVLSIIFISIIISNKQVKSNENHLGAKD